MFLCGTKNGYSMESLGEPFEAPLFFRALLWQNLNIFYFFFFIVTGNKILG